MATKAKQTCNTAQVNGYGYSGANYSAALSLIPKARENTKSLASEIVEKTMDEIRRIDQHLKSKTVKDAPDLTESYRQAKDQCTLANKNATHLLNLDVFKPRYHPTRKFLDKDLDTATSGLSEATRAYMIFKDYQNSHFSI